MPASADLKIVEQRIVAAAGVLRPGEAVTGWGSLAWRRARWFDGTLDGRRPAPVPLQAQRHLAEQPSYRLSQEFLAPHDLELVDGLPVTSVRSAVSFEARWADDLVSAVIAIDMAAYDDLTSITDLGRYIYTRMAPTGIGQARDALALAHENSWSPRETLMRLAWQWWRPESRLLCNHPVFDHAGRHLGTPDLLDPIAGVAADYEGEVHLVAERRSSDVRREARLRDAGLEVVIMVGQDAVDVQPFLARLSAAHDRAALQGRRNWTATLPSWWIDTSTVAARRALDPALRARLLGYRRVA